MNEYEIKVLVTANGHHIVAHVKEDDHPDFMRVRDPMMVHYHPIHDSVHGGVYSPPGVEASFMKYCCLTDDNEFSLNCNWIVSAHTPTDGVRESYLNTLNPPTIEIEDHDSVVNSPE
ncbi:hypothetical protein SCRM01_144c [Synechococcus phage S-CRM01]|uniref:hypothetical protein n=1 Tax=Synechococcus phage S-CRM01 TaxID=1026955 RepID=UPI000209E3E1|nr:hypothetical protein SCRM01_144c [Synechococcus phage S-CRM01]AEC53090.1 hypothetical protein SCRM01_144c [Synechococcus phage S-CRM01]